MGRHKIFFVFFWLISTFAGADEYRVLGVGTAAVDLLIQVDDNFFEAHVPGEKGGSFLCGPDTVSRILQAHGTAHKIVPGGSSANTMRALAKLGERSAFFSHIGADSLGDYFGKDLNKWGVIARLVKLSDLPTAQILCIITPDGQRTFRAFDPPVAHVLPAEEDFKNVQLVHLEARQLRNGSSVEVALQLAKKVGAQVSLDLSCFEIVREFRPVLLELIEKYVDIVFCNEDEIRALTGLPSQEGCLELQKITKIVAVTQGSKGCIVGQKGEIIVVPTYPATVVDTTGAGDLFAAGFLYGYLHNFSLRECALLGNRLGSAVVEVIGAQLPEVRWEEINALIRVEHP